MNDDERARPTPPLETLVSAIFDHVPGRVLNLAIDVVPDHVFRVVLSAHDLVVRASDATLMHAARIASRVRRAPAATTGSPAAE